MRQRVFASLVVSVLAAACSAAEPGGAAASGSDGPTAQATTPITVPCLPQFLGQACDPDGLLGPMVECEGICVLSSDTLFIGATCAKLADQGYGAHELDGQIGRAHV